MLSPDEKTNDTPVLLKNESIFTSCENSVAPQLQEITVAPCRIAILIALNKSEIELDLASITKIVAPGTKAATT